MRFLDVFLLHCLLCDSPPDTPEELAAVTENKQRVASRGREPRPARSCARAKKCRSPNGAGEVLADCGPIAAALDRAKGGHAHRDALAAAVAALADPDSTPSARVLQAMARDYGNSYVKFGLVRSHAHREEIMRLPLAPEVAERFARLAEESIEAQKKTEAEDKLPFEAFRQLYLAPIRLAE